MKTHKIATVLLLLLFFFMNVRATGQQNQRKPMDEWEALQISLKGAESIHPKNGFVPDESTAIQIAEAAVKAQHGKKSVSDEQPFHARLYGETWIVKGTLHPQGALGGTAVVKISKLDGKILFMTHNRRGLPCILAAVGLFFTVAETAASNKPSEAELVAITARGVLLAEYDTAAWQATDAVKAAHPVDGRMGRYIGRKTEAGWVVDFGRLNKTGDKFLVAYEVVQTAGLSKYEVKSFDPAKEDTGWNLAAAKGIENAVRDFRAADRPYNIAVLPAKHESIYVYLYPAQVKEGVYPTGADARYRVSPDGTKIIEKRQMHKAVIESVPSSAPGKVAGGYHTHVLSDLPEDTDVLLVLTRKPRVPEIVVAGTHLFTIDINGKISVADRPR